MKTALMIICSIAAGVIFFQHTTIRNLNVELEKKQVQIDSLHNENFPCQIELGRYQVAYQILLERNPKAAEQYGTIISEETE